MTGEMGYQERLSLQQYEIDRLREENAALKQKVVEMDECDRDIDRDWQQIQRRAAEVRPGCHSAYEALDLVPQLQAENSALKAERDGLAAFRRRIAKLEDLIATWHNGSIADSIALLHEAEEIRKRRTG